MINNPSPASPVPICSETLWQEGAATGAWNTPSNINDDTAAYTYPTGVGQLITVELPYPALVNRWRQMGQNLNNGTGRFKIELYDAENQVWREIVASQAIRDSTDWGNWTAMLATYLVSKIRLESIVQDTGDGTTYLAEFEVGYA